MARRALTITEAATRLGVERQRISQLLGEHRLEGPEYGPGRAPPNVPRVWASSAVEYDRARRTPRTQTPSRLAQLEQRVAELEAELKGERTSKRDQGRKPGSQPDEYAAQPHVPGSLTDTQSDAVKAALARERAARQAAVELKVTIDALQARSQEQLDKNASLRSQVAELEGRLEAASERADIIALTNQGFGNSLTHLLGPDSLEEA